MLKKLLMTTALVAVAATAQAQDATTPVAPDATMTAPDATTVAPGDLLFLDTPAMGAHLASNLIGETVFSSEAADAETIGQVNDLIVADNGDIEAVVIGVGGFLGVGEKNVAVDFDSIDWIAPTADQPAKLVLATTADQLQAAPEFDVSALEPMPVDATTLPATDDTAMTAPTDPALAPDTTTPDATTTPNDMAAAPADDTSTGAVTDPSAETAAVPSTGNLSDVDVASVSAEQLIGSTVYSADDENVGTVGDVILADDGTIDAVVLDIGGFLGIGTKPVAIGFDALTIRKDENDALFVYTEFTRALLEGAPDYDSERYPQERDMMRLETSS